MGGVGGGGGGGGGLGGLAGWQAGKRNVVNLRERERGNEQLFQRHSTVKAGRARKS